MTLKTRALHAAVWYGATRTLTQAMSWVVTIVLARLLTPADYGIFAMAVGALIFLELFQELGLGTAVVQRRHLAPAQLNAIFWLLMALSTLVGAVTFLGADVIASIYAEPRLAALLRLLSVTFLANSVRVVPYALLTKTLDLKSRSLADVAGTVMASAVALVTASMGLGVLALVWGHLARGVVLSAVMLYLSPWRPGLTVSFAELRSMLVFGGQMTATHLVGSVSPLVNNMLVARLLSGEALGLFTMAESISSTPHRISTALMNQVSLPVFSESQENRRTLQDHFLTISKYLAVVALPVQIGFALTAPELVHMVLSDKWLSVVVPLQILAIGGAVTAATMTATPLLSATGRADMLLRIGLVTHVALAVATVAGTPWNVTGLAVASLVVTVVARGYLFALTLRELAIPASRYAAAVLAPLKAVGAMSVAVIASQAAQPGLSPIMGLLMSVLIGGSVYVAVLFLSDHALYLEFRGIARELLSPAPSGA